MKEEVRQKVIEEYKERLRIIDEKIKRYKILLETPEVKEFLFLRRDLIGPDKAYIEKEKTNLGQVLTTSQMIETIFSKYSRECEHDVLICIYNCDDFKSYFCLDCGCMVSSKGNLEEFEKNRIIIYPKSSSFSYCDIRKYYLELLSTFNSEEAIKILKLKNKVK